MLVIEIKSIFFVPRLCKITFKNYIQLFDGLVQEKRNSIANALELRLSCTNLS